MIPSRYRGIKKTQKEINAVLVQMRNEFIDRYPRNYANDLELNGCSCVFSLNEILRIIDKYRKEQTDADSD